MSDAPQASALVVRAVQPEDAARLADLFVRADVPCFCRYWHFEGDKNAWLERTYVEVGTNRAELEGAVTKGSDEARGVVALDATGRIVGWLKVAPVASVTKAYAQKLYRNLPVLSGDRTGTYLLACAVVDPAERRHGVYRSLIRGAIEVAPTWGATTLEALPRRPREPVHDAELWVGHAPTLLEEGFVEVHAFEPYPVLRKVLAAPKGP